MFRQRTAGILLHISSLPGPYGIGDFGPTALAFVDFLKQARQHFWQLLPLNVTTAETGYSPYNCQSAFAGNPLFISPAQLWADGWLNKSDLSAHPSFRANRVEFNRVAALKQRLMKRAFERFNAAGANDDFQCFRLQHQD